jgi:hypothetical protein
VRRPVPTGDLRISNEVNFTVSVSISDLSWVSPVGRLRGITETWRPSDVRATVGRGEIGFTLDNHGHSVAAVSGEIGCELLWLMDVNA